MGTRDTSPVGSSDATGFPVKNTDFLKMFEEEIVFDEWNSTAEKAKFNTCEKAGGECMLKRTIKKTCNGEVDKKSKCDKRNYVCCISGCGGVYTTSSGVIRHPLSGGNYQNDEQCTWIIRTQHPIRMTFSSFNTEAHYDYLYIRDGESIESNVIGHFNGDSVPSPVQTSSNSAHLLFTSDVRGTAPGFELHWGSEEPVDQCIGDNGNNSALFNKMESAETAIETVIRASETAIETAIRASETAIEEDIREAVTAIEIFIHGSETAITETINEGNNITSAMEIRINNVEKELQSMKDDMNTKLDIILHIVNTTKTPPTTTAPPLTMAPPTTTVDTTSATTCMTTAPPAPPECESPWVSINNSGCFLIVKIENVWGDAVSYCRNKGGALTILECWDKRFELYTYLESTGLNNIDFWVGGNKRSDSWVWLNNNTITDGWKANEPNPYLFNNRPLCLLVNMYIPYNDNLKVYVCDARMHFICEKY